MPDGERTEDFGRVETPAGIPHAMRSRAWIAALDRRFQLNVLILFCVAVFVSALLDGAARLLFSDTILDSLLRVIVPVFTFVLGIGIKIDRD